MPRIKWVTTNGTSRREPLQFSPAVQEALSGLTQSAPEVILPFCARKAFCVQFVMSRKERIFYRLEADLIVKRLSQGVYAWLS